MGPGGAERCRCPRQSPLGHATSASSATRDSSSVSAPSRARCEKSLHDRGEVGRQSRRIGPGRQFPFLLGPAQPLLDGSDARVAHVAQELRDLLVVHVDVGGRADRQAARRVGRIRVDHRRLAQDRDTAPRAVDSSAGARREGPHRRAAVHVDGLLGKRRLVAEGHVQAARTDTHGLRQLAQRGLLEAAPSEQPDGRLQRRVPVERALRSVPGSSRPSRSGMSCCSWSDSGPVAAANTACVPPSPADTRLSRRGGSLVRVGPPGRRGGSGQSHCSSAREATGAGLPMTARAMKKLIWPIAIVKVARAFLS